MADTLGRLMPPSIASALKSIFSVPSATFTVKFSVVAVKAPAFLNISKLSSTFVPSIFTSNTRLLGPVKKISAKCNTTVYWPLLTGNA